MMQTRLGKMLSVAAVSLAATLGYVGSANALVYKGTFDPAYGPWFPDLYWKGNSFVTIPDACVVANGTINSGTCYGMTAGWADVELSSISDPNLTEKLSFNQTVGVSQATFAGGILTGVTSAFFAPQLATLAAASVNGDQYWFTLKLDDPNGAKLYHLIDGTYDGHRHQVGQGHESHGQGYGYGHLDTCALSETINTQYCGHSETFGLVNYVPVPEPETYAMMLAGLAAVGFMARRRRH